MPEPLEPEHREQQPTPQAQEQVHRERQRERQREQTPQAPQQAAEPDLGSSAMPTAEAELFAGSAVLIGDRLCRITSPLGMGSFGVVWAADCAGVGEVAVKEILCHTEAELSRAVYEAQLLWALSKGAAKATVEGSVPLRFPLYVASDVAEPSPGSEACRVRLAMSRLPGVALDKFLQDQRGLLDGASRQPGAPSFLASQADEACGMALALVSQLASAVEQISHLAYHRDVNAHNILIAFDEDIPQYGLVDFGLAVDASRWREEPGSASQGEWRHLDVGGDCRYWPASAWLQFEVGCYELAEAPAFCAEYQTHLDFQGLGITTLQVLVELLPPLDSASVSESAFLAELRRLQLAWEEYWEIATRYWLALLNTFRHGGDWNLLKHEFIEIGVHSEIARKLGALRSVLRELLARSRDDSGARAADAQALFAALLVLISSGEERWCPTTWQEVHGCLAQDRNGECQGPRSGTTLSSASTAVSTAANSRAVSSAGSPCLAAPAPRVQERPRLPEPDAPGTSQCRGTDGADCGVASSESSRQLELEKAKANAVENSNLGQRLQYLAEKAAELAKVMEALEQQDLFLAAGSELRSSFIMSPDALF